MELMEYFQMTHDVLAYTIIVLVTLLTVKDDREKISLMIILSFYLFAPIVRCWLPIFNEHPKDYYVFYTMYEIALLMFLFVFNANHERMAQIYIVSMCAVFLNYYIYLNFYNAGGIIEYYEYINKTFVDITILLLITSLGKRQTMALSGALIIVPIAINLL